jgi:hypothetical protein
MIWMNVFMQKRNILIEKDAHASKLDVELVVRKHNH